MKRNVLVIVGGICDAISALCRRLEMIAKEPPNLPDPDAPRPEDEPHAQIPDDEPPQIPAI